MCPPNTPLSYEYYIRMRNTILLISIYILSGCAASLNKEKTSTHIAQDAGIEVSSILNTFRGTFSVYARTSFASTVKKCVFTITDTEIYIYVSHSDDDKLELEMRIPYAEMRGIDLYTPGRPFFIYILGDVGIVEISISKPESTFVDRKAIQKLYNYIKSKGVPEFSAKGD